MTSYTVISSTQSMLLPFAIKAAQRQLDEAIKEPSVQYRRDSKEQFRDFIKNK